MARRPSSIDRLPDDIREQFYAWLRAGRLTQIQITAMTNAALVQAGEDMRVTKSSVNRKALRIEEAGKKLREARELREALVAQLGQEPEGEQGRLTIAFLDSLSTEIQMLVQDREVTEEDLHDTIGMLHKLTLIGRNIEEARKMNVGAALAVRRAERELIAGEVADEARAQGMDEEQAEFWRRKILGIHQ